jgi:hypothetical protein
MWYELLTRDFWFAWCVSAATLVIEHAVCRPRETPFWPRYVLGVLALLAGAFAYEYVAARPARALILGALSTAGALILALYSFDVRIKAALRAAREAGKIEGRAREAARRAWQGRRPGNRSD